MSLYSMVSLWPLEYCTSRTCLCPISTPQLFHDCDAMDDFGNLIHGLQTNAQYWTQQRSPITGAPLRKPLVTPAAIVSPTPAPAPGELTIAEIGASIVRTNLLNGLLRFVLPAKDSG